MDAKHPSTPAGGAKDDLPHEPNKFTGMRMLPVESTTVSSWTPLLDGAGRSTEVHVVFKLRDADAVVVTRLKSARAVNELIAALETHRNDVWGDG